MNNENNETDIPRHDEEPEEVEVSFVSGRSAVRYATVKGGAVDLLPAEKPDTVPSPVIVGGPDADDAADDEVRHQLRRAREHLRKNELDEALPLAMDVLRTCPDMAEAKTLIARCYINRREYKKARAVLQSIPGGGENVDACYYLGLCKARMGDVQGAAAVLEEGIEVATDADGKKRMVELLRHLRDGDAACPECGRETRYGSMKDVGDRTLCEDCAAIVLRKTSQGRRTPGSARTAPRGGILSRIFRRAVWVPVVGVLAWLLLYAVSGVAPDKYDEIRSRLPAGWTFLPKAGQCAASAAPSLVAVPNENDGVAFDAAPLEFAVAGVPFHLRAETKDGSAPSGFAAQLVPEPQGRYRIDERTGRFTWTPSDVDAGNMFTFFLNASDGGFDDGSPAGKRLARIQVLPPPHFQRLHPLGAPGPDGMLQLLAADFTGDGLTELVVVQGRYRKGRAAILRETADGLFHPVGEAAFPGRPVGSGIVKADGKDLIAVADYWGSCIRRFAFRGGGIVELSAKTSLPGKPVLAGFDRASGISAALCKTDSAMRLTGYRTVSGEHTEKLGDWDVPQGHVWRKLLALPERGVTGESPRFLLIGGNPGESVFLFSPGKGEPVHAKLDASGTIVDAASGGDGLIYCLLEDKGKYQVAGFRLDKSGQPADVVFLPAGQGPFLNGIAALHPFTPEAGVGVAVLSATRIGFVLPGPGGETEFAQWELPAPSRLCGPAAVLPGRGGDPDRIAYQDSEGVLWCVGLDEAYSERAEK